MGNDIHPFHIHETVFTPSLMLQCDDEQKNIWFKRALNREILGTYAQTEIGHGQPTIRI